MKENILKLIKENLIQKSLDTLEAYATEREDSSFRDNVIILSSRYSSASLKLHIGEFSTSDYDKELVKIKMAILAFASDVEDVPILVDSTEYDVFLRNIDNILDAYTLRATTLIDSLSRITSKIPFITDNDANKSLSSFMKEFTEFFDSLPNDIYDRERGHFEELKKSASRSMKMFEVSQILQTMRYFIEGLKKITAYHLDNPSLSYYEKELRRIIDEGHTNEAIKPQIKINSIQKLHLIDGTVIQVGIDRIVENVLFYYTGKGLRVMFPRSDKEKLPEYDDVKSSSEEYLILQKYKSFMPLYLIEKVE